jgi:thymidylate synthase (FAD)
VMRAREEDCKVELVRAYGDWRDCVLAARASFGAPNKTEEEDFRLFTFLCSQKPPHTGPLEFAFFWFRFRIPLYVAVQILRHRTMSFAQLSGRYKKHDGNYFSPDLFRTNNKSNKQDSGFDLNLDQGLIKGIYDSSIEESINKYLQLIDLGVCREQARGVLPESIMTTLNVCGNWNNWIKFFILRLDEHTQKETRDICRKAFDIAVETQPEFGLAFDLMVSK